MWFDNVLQTKCKVRNISRNRKGEDDKMTILGGRILNRKVEEEIDFPNRKKGEKKK